MITAAPPPPPSSCPSIDREAATMLPSAGRNALEYYFCIIIIIGLKNRFSSRIAINTEII